MRTPRRRAAVLLAAPIAAFALTAGACGGPQLDPCRDVAATVDDMEAAKRFAAANPQLEIEGQGYSETECILTPGGRFVDETQLETEEEEG